LEAVVPTPITFHIFDRSGQHVRSETLTQDVIKIGKLDSSHLKLEDEGVSRMHSVVEVSAAGEVFVIDLGSTTGTIVNGQRVSKAQLNPGDQLQFGNLTVQIDFGEGDEAEEPPPAADPSTVLGYAAPGQPAYQQPAYAQPQQPAAAGRPASRTATMMGGNQTAPNPFAAPATAGGFGAGGAPAAFGATQQGYGAPQQQYAQAHAYGAQYDNEPAEGDEEGGDNVMYQLIPQTPPINPADVDSGESAVEIVILWGELSILHVEHLSPPRSYYVGEATDSKGKPATDFLIGRESIGTERLPIWWSRVPAWQS